MRILGILALAACTQSTTTQTTASPPATMAPAAAGAFTVVPQGMVGVALVGASAAPDETISADALVQKRADVDREAQSLGRSSERSPGLFFYGFDKSRLVYFYGRTHWRCAGLGCWDYVAEKMYVVRRDGRVESRLGVKSQIDLYESGSPIRGGMTMDEVKAVLGAPARVEPLQYAGSERWHYPDRTILFLDMRVAKIEAP